MATVETIHNEVLRELSHAAGRNVQILSQDRICYRINRAYRMLFTKYWWDEHFKSKVVTIGPNGSTVDDMRQEITRLKDIHSVYYGTETSPLGWHFKGQNIQTIRKRGLFPTASLKSIFTLVPMDTTGSLTINYRTFKEEDFKLDDNVPLDKDLLVLAVASWFSTSDALNDALTQRLTAEFNDHLNTLIKSEVRDSYNYQGSGVNVMTDWFEK